MTEALERQVKSRVGQGSLLFLRGCDGGGRSEGGTALAGQRSGNSRRLLPVPPRTAPTGTGSVKYFSTVG